MLTWYKTLHIIQVYPIVFKKVEDKHCFLIFVDYTTDLNCTIFLFLVDVQVNQ